MDGRKGAYQHQCSFLTYQELLYRAVMELGFYCLLINLKQLMKRVFPAVNRITQLKEVQRSNDILLNRISRMKFVNFTSLHSKKSSRSLLKASETCSAQRAPSQIRSRRAKTVLDYRNSQEPSRQKDQETSDRNNKPIAQFSSSQRQQNNLQVSSNNKKHPQKLSKKDSSDFDPFQRSRTLGQLTQLQQNFNSIKVQIKSSIKCIDRMKTLNAFAKITEQGQKQHEIILWNRVVQIQKVWHLVKFLRYKNHYQIEVIAYSEENILYTAKIPEQIGMNLLTENDYDYEYITNNYIKSSHHFVCIGFELQSGQSRTKHMFKFQRSTIEHPQTIKHSQQPNPPTPAKAERPHKQLKANSRI